MKTRRILLFLVHLSILVCLVWSYGLLHVRDEMSVEQLNQNLANLRFLVMSSIALMVCMGGVISREIKSEKRTPRSEHTSQP